MRHSLITMMMAAAFIACSHHAFAAKAKNIKIDTVRYEKSDTTAEVSLLVHWPVKGDKAVVDSLRKFVCTLLGSDDIDSPKAIQACGESLFESLSIDWHSVYDDMAPEDRLGAFTKTHSFFKEAETNKYVTYFYRTHEYQGGIHGYTTEVGFTFRKSDGKQIPLLTNTDSPQLAKLIKEGVRSFFAGSPDKLMSDEELLDYLFAEQAEDLDNIPLPGNAPYLSETGVVFLYTQYEIAPYSSGIITFEIPFADITPFLTPEAKELIP